MDLRRPRQTLADYLGTGISPVLIMALVGTLVFFLFELFYEGPYAGRLRWVLFWFVLAMVLVSRISIERGLEYALLYGIALAAATGYLIVQLAGVVPTAFVLLGLIWWATGKLTWDCTVVEEGEDTGGEGLLQAGGLSGRRGEPDSARERKNSRSREGAGQTPARTGSPRRPEPNDSFHVIRPDRSRPHAPGVWLIYFCLATLPVFGIGQTFLPETDQRYGFQLFGLHIVAGMGLLMTTSFLGLRRSLRRSYLQMPAAMTRSWLLTGIIMAVFILVICLVLPRPDSVFTMDRMAESSNPDASEYAQQTGDSGQGEGAPGGAATERTRQSPRESEQGKEEKEGKARRSGEAGGEQQRDPSGDSAQSGGNSAQERRADQTAQETQSVETSIPFETAAQWIRWGIYIVAALFALYLILTRASQLWRAMVSLLREVAAFWKNLFKNRKSGPVATSTETSPEMGSRPFSEYENPFEQGWADQVGEGELLRYSFEALEAWATEQGWGRSEEQTPLEYGRQLAGALPALSEELRRVIHGYVLLAYSGREPSGSCREELRRLWEAMSGGMERMEGRC